MKNYFESNKQILKAYGKEDLINDTYFQVEKCNDGNLTFEYNMYNKTIHINSCYNVQNEVNDLIKNVDFNNDHLFIVYGMGMGYHINEIMKRATSRSRIFVIESDEYILNTFIRNKDILEFNDNRVILFFGNESKIISDFNSHIFSFDILSLSTSIVPIIMPAYYSIYGEKLNILNKRILDLFRHAMFNLGNDIDDTIIGLRQNFENINELIKSSSPEYVKQQYINKPAIIVGAGPSLDKNIQYLKEAEGKALILATDAVISTLDKYNIIPDAVVSIERDNETYDAFYKNNNVNDKIVFIGPPVVSPLILKKIKKNKKIMCLKEGEKINEWLNNDILKENRLIKMGTSCSHVALGFARYIGANPIVFIGQDLAFTKEGVTHSNYVEVREQIEGIEEELYYVDGIDGQKLPTNIAYKNFLTFLEIEVASDKSNVEYIDATEGGAYKNGMILMKLKDVIEKYCKNHVQRLYDNVNNNNEYSDEKIHRAVLELSGLLKNLKNFNIEVKKQIKKIKKIIKKDIYDNKELERIKEIISEGNTIIKDIIMYNDILRTFFQSLCINYETKNISLGNKNDIVTYQEKLDIYSKYLNNLSIGCNYCIKECTKVLENIVKDDTYEQ